MSNTKQHVNSVDVNDINVELDIVCIPGGIQDRVMEYYKIELMKNINKRLKQDNTMGEYFLENISLKTVFKCGKEIFHHSIKPQISELGTKILNVTKNVDEKIRCKLTIDFTKLNTRVTIDMGLVFEIEPFKNVVYYLDFSNYNIKHTPLPSKYQADHEMNKMQDKMLDEENVKESDRKKDYIPINQVNADECPEHLKRFVDGGKKVHITNQPPYSYPYGYQYHRPFSWQPANQDPIYQLCERVRELTGRIELLDERIRELEELD